MKILLKLIGTYLNILSYISPKIAGKHGYYVFCFPAKARLKKEQKSYLLNHKHYDFEFEGNRINLYRWGHGPRKVLLLHGWRSNSYRWKKYIEEYSLNEFTFYAIDAPGHGLSGGTFLNLLIYGRLVHHVLMELENIETIIGHSMGAFASLFNFYEFENPVIKNLVLLGTPGEVTDFVIFFNKLLGLNKQVFKQVSAYFEKISGYNFKYFSAKEFASEIGMDGLIVHDEEDNEAPVHHARAIANQWTSAEIVITKGNGHKLNNQSVRNLISVFLFLEKFDHLEQFLAEALDPEIVSV